MCETYDPSRMVHSSHYDHTVFIQTTLHSYYVQISSPSPFSVGSHYDHFVHNTFVLRLPRPYQVHRTSFLTILRSYTFSVDIFHKIGLFADYEPTRLFTNKISDIVTKVFCNEILYMYIFKLLMARERIEEILVVKIPLLENHV